MSFLFTDIEGSSLMWSRARDRMGAVVSRLIELANAATAAEGGTLVRERGEGDSHFLVFDRASAAVRAACSLQRSILTESWPLELEPRVRMGIHTGECNYAEGDYLGVAVNQAARVRATAHGGQIVTSHVVAILAQDLVDIRLRPLGSFRVRDFAEPELLHQVEAPGLPRTFPALETLENAVPPVTAIISLDLVGASTRLTGLAPGGIGEAQARFMRFLRNRFEAGGGRYIKLLGDGCIALFDSPLAAVDFIHEVSARTGSRDHEIRAGLHIGHVDMVEREPVGVAIVITHALMERAEPGSIVVSPTAADVLQGYGITTVPGPVVALVGVPGEWQTYTVQSR